MLRHLVFVICLLPALVAAKEPPLEGVCAQIDNKINTLLGAQISQCVPAKGSTPGTYSLLFLAKKPVLSDPQNKRAWLLAIVGGAGWAMTELPEMKGVKVSEVLTTDKSLSVAKKYLSLPGASVKQWRNDLYSGKRKPLDVYAAIEKAAVERTANQP
jgi:hypothetical protein